MNRRLGNGAITQIARAGHVRAALEAPYEDPVACSHLRSQGSEIYTIAQNTTYGRRAGAGVVKFGDPRSWIDARECR